MKPTYTANNSVQDDRFGNASPAWNMLSVLVIVQNVTLAVGHGGDELKNILQNENIPL